MGLLLRALWWRRGLSVATLIVAVITIGAGSLGPLYGRAADESTLRDALIDSAGPASLHFTFTRDLQTEGDLDTAAALGPKPGSIRGFPTLVVAAEAKTRAALPTQVAAGNSGPRSKFVWRQDICAHVRIVSGHCVSGAGQAIISERTAQGGYGWKPGATLELDSLYRDSTSGGQGGSEQLLIVGTYRQRDTTDPYWYSHDYFDAHPGHGDDPDTVDAMFVDREELGNLSKPTRMQVQLDYPIAPSQLRLADVGLVQSGVAALQSFRSDASNGDTFTTSVSQVLTTIKSQQHQVNLSTLLVSLQLAVLAWLVLFQVIADAAEAKGPEIALAKLRGLGPVATVRFGLAESVLLVAAATPLGLAAGWLAVRIFASAVLAPNTPVVITQPTLLAVLVALAGSLVAALAASRRTLQRSVLEQWRRTPGHRPSRWMLVLDVLLAAAAVAGLVLLRRSSTAQNPQPASLLAPALLVFAVALLGIRLLPLILRPLLPATRGSARIGFFLAVRQVVRRPAGLRLAALLAVAVGLATFAIAGEGVAQANRIARAEVEIGAPRTALVQFEPDHDPIAATHRADPDGQWAMATASFLPDGGGSVTGTVLGVDTKRLAAVGYSGGLGISTTELARDLLPPTVPPPVPLTATALRVQISSVTLPSGPKPSVQFNLRRAGQPYLTADAGALVPGTHTYTANVPCSAGCTLVGLTWNRPLDTFGPLTGTVTVNSLQFQHGGQWNPLEAGLANGNDWRQASQAGNVSDQVSAGPNGLTDRFSADSGASAGIAHNDSPSPLPAVASRQGVASGPDVVKPLAMTDTSGASARYELTRTVNVLPSVLDQGVMVDLAAIRSQLPAFDDSAQWSIWLGPKAPADALARLTAAGLTVQPGPSEAKRQTELSRQGPALALRLLVVCAIAGSVLAVGGTAIAIAATGRRRTFELASLRALGIGRRTLFTGSTVEQLLLLGAALVLGVPSGYFAARLSMPAIPEFADATPVGQHYAPHLGGVLEFALLFAVLLALTAVVAARALIAAAAPARLREAE